MCRELDANDVTVSSRAVVLMYVSYDGVLKDIKLLHKKNKIHSRFISYCLHGEVAANLEVLGWIPGII